MVSKPQLQHRPCRDIIPSDGDYTVGWICALWTEFNAAENMLDVKYDVQFGDVHDNNLYILGRIAPYNVVLMCLPNGWRGNNVGSMAVNRMMSRFQNIKIGLMVGIGGGLPSEENDIRLGDIVVGKPVGVYGRVVQYDLEKWFQHGFMQTGSLPTPPKKLLGALERMPCHGNPLRNNSPGPPTPKPERSYPGEELDQLYNLDYGYTSGNTREWRDQQKQQSRPPGNRQNGPCVFYGTIASGTDVIEDVTKRDKLIKEHGVLCCEMQATGLMNSSFPCLVIRGISDYADSHKNDKWQDYAAAMASQYAKEFLEKIPQEDVHDLSPIKGMCQTSVSLLTLMVSELTSK